MSENPRDPFGGCQGCALLRQLMDIQGHHSTRMLEIERNFGKESLRIERKFARMDRWIAAAMGGHGGFARGVTAREGRVARGCADARPQRRRRCRRRRHCARAMVAAQTPEGQGVTAGDDYRRLLALWLERRDELSGDYDNQWYDWLDSAWLALDEHEAEQARTEREP
jgi:hypothetical protein